MNFNIPYSFNPMPYYINSIPPGPDQSTIPLTFIAKATSNILLSSIGTPNAISLSYKKNNGSWNAYTLNTRIDLASGDTVSFSGANDHFSKNGSNYYRFYMTGNIEASGNIQSLMNFSNSVPASGYHDLFSGCTSLRTPPLLPASSLASSCYRNMFEGCSNLLSAPVLPATTLFDSSYMNMFARCYALTKAPQLPATTVGSHVYQDMFSSCSSLTTPPSIFPAMNMNNLQLCYANTFNGCKSLTAVPILPASSLALSGYYGMFRSCSKLSSAPILSATTLANGCYEYMFDSCAALTAAPDLPATTLKSRCYNQMFRYCSKLSSINVSFTSWLSNSTSNWLYNVASNGTFTCPTALGTQSSITKGTSNCPNNWTVVNK